jgi:hypothetical protein
MRADNLDIIVLDTEARYFYLNAFFSRTGIRRSTEEITSGSARCDVQQHWQDGRQKGKP